MEKTMTLLLHFNLKKLRIKFYFLCLFLVFILTNCVKVGVKVEKASPSTLIMAQGQTNYRQLAQFLKSRNENITLDYALKLSQTYIQESRKEGVSHDVAFSQMLLETGNLKFGNQVHPSQNNFCGLGALDGGAKGAVFPDMQTGVRAHIQHLKAYASKENLIQPLVDPRFKYVKRGSAPTLSGLAGTWASDKEYAYKISGILNLLYKN